MQTRGLSSRDNDRMAHVSVFAVIGVVLAAGVFVALVILAFDVLRGDVGGHQTMARARRLLVISTDDRTHAGAERWMAEQRKEHPKLQFFVLAHKGGDEQALFMDVQASVERDRPDAVVMARHDEESHSMQEGTFGRIKEDLPIPVDAIYIPKEAGA